MKEIRSIVTAYNTIDKSANVAMATVVRVEGSSYRRTGARMLILEDGTFIGGISGGCLEGDVLRRMQKAIFLNKPSIARYDTMNKEEHQIGVGLGCQGIIDVLITPLQTNEQNIVTILASITETRKPEALLTIIDSPTNRNRLGISLLYKSDLEFIQSFPEKDIAENILYNIKISLHSKKSQICVYEDITLFIEVILPVTHLVIYGGNYDVNPLIHIAKEMGWHITVCMNKIKAGNSIYHYADQIIDTKTNDEPLIDNYTAVMLMSHDYNTDKNNLIKTLNTNTSYIGILGPGKRSNKIFADLISTGINITERDRERIFSPAGLDIGANTPEEIALSIMAEIKCSLSGRNGMFLRERQGTIYEY